MKLPFYQKDPNRPGKHVYWEDKDAIGHQYMIPVFKAMQAMSVGQLATPDNMQREFRTFELRMNKGDFCYMEI